MRPEGAEGLTDNIEDEAHAAWTLYGAWGHWVPAADLNPVLGPQISDLRLRTSDFGPQPSDLRLRSSEESDPAEVRRPRS